MRGHTAAFLLLLVIILIVDIVPISALLLGIPRELQRGASGLSLTTWFQYCWGSLRLAGATAASSVLLGVVTALSIEWGEAFGRRFWRSFLVLPFVTPPYLLTLALISWQGIKAPILGESFYSWPICVVILGFYHGPIVALLLSLCWSRLDRESLSAVRLSCGRLGVVCWLLDYGKYALLLGFSLVFLLTLGCFTTPQLLRVKVLSELIYSRFSDFSDFAGALLACVPLMIFAGIGVVFVSFAFRRANLNLELPVKLNFERSCLVKTLATLVLGLLILGPFLWPVYIFLCDWLKAPETVDAGLFGLWKFALDRPLYLSLATGFAVAATNFMVLSLMSFCQLHRELSHSWTAALLFLAVVPGPLLGIGMIWFWNCPLLADFYDSPLMPYLAHLGRSFPLIIVLWLLLARKQSVLCEQAARLANRNPFMLPGCWRDNLALAALTFTLSVSEYATTSLVSAPNNGLVAERLINLVHFGRSGETAVLSLCLSMASVLLFALILVPLVGERSRT